MEGVLSAIAVPFRDGRLDYEGLVNHVESLIKAGVDGFFPLGTTSQGILLNLDERRLVLETVFEHAKGKYVVVQVASTDWNVTIETIRMAERYGADAVASIVPLYYRPDYDTLRRYFSKLAELTKLPIYIYNIPGNVGFNVTPDMVARLIKDGVRISGVKDSSGDIGQVASLVEQGIDVFNGSDHIIAHALAVGAKGCISALSNSIPELVVDIYRRFRSGDMKGAFETQRMVSRIREISGRYQRPAVYYSLVKLLKYDFGGVKEPLVRNLTQEEERRLAEELAAIGLKVRVR